MSYSFTARPQTLIDEFGFTSKDREEPVENLITWVFEEGTFKPCAKISENGRYSIITDYLGTPVESYDAEGNLVWQRELNIYGEARKQKGITNFIPFLYQGQYFDAETDLAYNRFRYYSPNEGIYISQDPIGLAGGNPTLYGYVGDVNVWVDVFGLYELYALVAKKDGWYPVMKWGQKKPIGEVFLKKGDLWKIGTSKYATKRYTLKFLKNTNLRLIVLHTGISQKTTLFLENLKLRGYNAWKGFLPPGNKCKH